MPEVCASISRARVASDSSDWTEMGRCDGWRVAHAKWQKTNGRWQMAHARWRKCYTSGRRKAKHTSKKAPNEAKLEMTEIHGKQGFASETRKSPRRERSQLAGAQRVLGAMVNDRQKMTVRAETGLGVTSCRPGCSRSITNSAPIPVTETPAMMHLRMKQPCSAAVPD